MMIARALAFGLFMFATIAAAQSESEPSGVDTTDDGKRFMRHWYDAMQRCYDSLSLSQPFQAEGFEHVGEQTVDYQTADTRQLWASPAPYVGVTFRIRGGSGTPDGLSPSCEVETLARFELLENAEEPIEVFYLRWWRANGFEAQSVPEEWPFQSKKHITNLTKTLHGTAAGCPMYMKFQYFAWETKPEAKFSIWETSEGGCDLPPRLAGSDFGNAPMPDVDGFFERALGDL